MNKEKIKEEALEMMGEHDNLRYGQCIFNVCAKYYREVDELRGCSLDCYYDNDKVEVFLNAIGRINVMGKIR